MHHERHHIGNIVALVAAFLLILPTLAFAGAPGLSDPDAAKAIDKCQAQIAKAGAKFLSSKLKRLDKCVAAIFKCIQTQGGTKQADCLTKAQGKCNKELDAIFNKDEPKLEADIAKKCTSDADALAAEGLGFSNVAAECLSQFGITVNNVEDMADCIRAHKECTAERMFRVEMARALELLNFADLNTTFVGNLTCLQGASGSGAGFGDTDPKGAGKALDACAKESKKAGAKFAAAKLKSVEKCTNAIFKCIQTKPGDAACLDKAQATCAKELGPNGKVAVAGAKLQSSVGSKCAAAGITNLGAANGMNLADLAAVCQAVGVTGGIPSIADYGVCLFRQHECEADETIRFEVPRLNELLTLVGFDDEVPASFCGPQPTPTVTVTPTPTATPTLTPIPTVTSTPNTCGNGTLEVGEACDASSSVPAEQICPNAGNGNQVCDACTCHCPSLVTFEADADSASSSLDTGWTGQAHDAVIINDGVVTVALTGCDDGTPDDFRDPDCGVCDISGPLVNPDAGAGQIDSQRCRLDKSVSCTADSDCPGAGNACVFFFGAPLPLSAGGTPACVFNEFAGPIVGTANIETGVSSNSVSLISQVHLGAGGSSKPCHNCLGDTTVNDGMRQGTCDTGARAGLLCDVQGRSPIPAFNGGVPAMGKVNGTSLDCYFQEVPATHVGRLPINLSNSTGSNVLTVAADGPSCSASGATTLQCVCDTCATAAAQPCSSDSQCPGAIAGSCGGLRCLGGGAAGTACTTPGIMDPACSGAPCGKLGEPSKPNGCTSGTCTPVGGNEGECTTGPFPGNCGPTETFKGCSAPSDCTFPGDMCVFASLECFLTNGTIGESIVAQGMADVPVNDVANPVLGSVFCIAPTGASAINTASGLPGAGRVTLTGTATGLP
jgi:hypothetical protein